MSKDNCILVGDSGVGKTAFLTRHLGFRFKEFCVSTLGVDVRSINAKLTILDTAGQEKFRDVRASYYQRATFAIVMFDLTSKLTFENVPTWIAELRSVCRDIPIVVVGNKVDLNDRKVSEADIFNASWRDDVRYCEISVKTAENLNEPLTLLMWYL